MPSRPHSILSSSSSSSSFSPSSKTRVLFFFTAAISASLLLLVATTYLFFHLCCSICNRPRTTPFRSPSNYKLRKFSLRELRSATNGFPDSNLLGRGGSGTVFHGVLRSGHHIAVKLLDADSIQAEREFQNELHILSGVTSPFVVSLLGFCVAKSNRFLVFEYMPNRSLQESLFSEGSSSSNLPWALRFGILLDVARALAFLHGECEPPVIHGDIKPSNVLLDSNYRARVSDFGLSRLKIEEDGAIDMCGQEQLGFKSQELFDNPDLDYDFTSTMKNQSLSSSSSSKHFNKTYTHHKKITSSNTQKESEISLSAASAVEEDSSRTKHCDNDWWWKQDEDGNLCTKDHVMEWIGSQIFGEEEDINDSDKEKPKKWNEETVGSTTSKKKRRKMKEWWKEEYLTELSKKTCNTSKLKAKYINKFKLSSFKKDKMGDRDGNHNKHGMEFGFRAKKKKKEGEANAGGIDMLCSSGDVFSRELSSATSMRGTLCYVAPEYGGCGLLVEKSDVYSFGVLILVVLSGRRPLHVLSSPMKFERANLINWCRQLSRTGNVLEVMDDRLVGVYDTEKACVCIRLALTCLQRMPELRPSMEDVVRILNGEMDLPPLVVSGSSPSPMSMMSKRKDKSNTP